ncbi:hypothetical protein [Streptomyces cucumeris]|uniref:hypothetical protein n=1 Tax=Streptomyces cucumeris TaxID=2962890 RepID=UPI003D713A1A
MLRGNSASGKSFIAVGLRVKFGRNLAIIAQDNLRRIVLRERDRPGGANIGLTDLSARYAKEDLTPEQRTYTIPAVLKESEKARADFNVDTATRSPPEPPRPASPGSTTTSDTATAPIPSSSSASTAWPAHAATSTPPRTPRKPNSWKQKITCRRCVR